MIKINTLIKENAVEFQENNGVYKTVLFHSASRQCPGTLDMSDECPPLSRLLAGLCDCV